MVEPNVRPTVPHIASYRQQQVIFHQSCSSAALIVFMLAVVYGIMLELVSYAGPVVRFRSDWRWMKGTAEASNPVSGWRQTAYDDAHWLTGPAPFYFGEPLQGGTILNDMQNRYSSVFLRKTFTLPGSAGVQELRLRVLCDDGFIAWINGTEVVRRNVPQGEPEFDTFASAAVAEPVDVLELILPDSGYLRTGTNVLAVQVFNSSLTSSDLQWDAELITTEADTEAPRVVSLLPEPGPVERLSEIVVLFSEPVTGVKASDLLLGGQAARQVAGSGERYVFEFRAVDSGQFELRWEADTLITDLATPANRFDPAGAGTRQYEIIDQTAPVLIATMPRSGVTVRELTQVEVQFSEPVQGVEASDLLANGVAATNLVVTPSGWYRFQFPQPAPGAITIAWVNNHGIRDVATPAHAFVGGSWIAQLDPGYVPPAIRINEFLASNVAPSGLRDEDNEWEDWIELVNASAAPANLAGWSLTDDRDDPDRWVFPDVTIAPGEHLVVFASEKNRRLSGPASRLHTNFKLNPNGEYLALLSPESPRRVVHEFAPSYPEQRNDISFGLNSAGESRHFRTPTPGAPNGTSTLQGVVPPLRLSVARGWFDAPFTLEITSSMPEVTIRYTTDGSEPNETRGQTYSGPLQVLRTTILRVAGFKPNTLPSAVSTHTYLFAQDILRQPNEPPGFPAGPTAWDGFPSDYELDPEILNHPAYRGVVTQAWAALPTLSLVARTDDLFSATSGIYIHPLSRGPAWERPCSAEFIPNDGSAGFAINAGLQVQGNASREPQKQPKHALRLVFKGDYGPRQLEYPLFPDSPITEFDTLVLRADFNFSWLHWNPHQRARAQRTRDAWMKDTMRAMGGLATHNRYVHLFLNGLYWGVYDPSERPDGAFAASYLGGEKEDYDVMNEGQIVDGGRAAYDQMVAVGNVGSAAGFEEMQRRLDMRQFIDYMLLHFYVAHQDWGANKNWYAFRPKNGSRGYFYIPWDGEMILDELNHNRVNSSDTPSGLHSKLVASAEYRLAFADRVYKHLFNGGALTPEAVEANWTKRADEIELAIVAESARWGDYRRDVHPFQNPPYELYARDDQFRAEQNRLLTQYFPRRTSVLLGQLRQEGLFPDVAPPRFNHAGGHVTNGFAVALSAPDGKVYFTSDGSDPRTPFTGAVAAGAQSYTGPIALTRSTRIKARTFRENVWSALAEADFHVNSLQPPVRITEIMYNPPGGDTYEFIELQNAGTIPVDLGGFTLAGVDYVFPHRTEVAPGQVLLLGSGQSPSAFAGRYVFAKPFGYFKGALSNGGERLSLQDKQGRTVTAVTYSDEGAWPAEADGEGFSIELNETSQDPAAPASWRASRTVHGSPGLREVISSSSDVLLNEVFASSPAQSNSILSDDWVELLNTGESPVPLAGWTLTDDNGSTFAFPEGTVLAPDGFLVVWCGENSNAPGLRAPFGLGRQSETILLHDREGHRMDGLSYGPQVAGFTLGRMEAGWELTVPTPGALNVRAALGSSTSLRLNEWLANAAPGEDDWIELYNSDPQQPVALRGVALEIEGGLFQMDSYAFVPAAGFVQLIADEGMGGDHLGLRLPAAGGFIQIVDLGGVEIDRIEYGLQPEAISEGRLVDGGEQIGLLREGPSPGASNVSHPSTQDRDKDGLPDAWEIANGTNPDAADADTDPDDDGLSNGEEYLAGTIPTNRASTLQIQRIQFVPGGVMLEFPAIAGRSYSVFYGESLGAGSWQKLSDVIAGPNDRTERIVDATFGRASRYYRVVTPAQP